MKITFLAVLAIAFATMPGRSDVFDGARTAFASALGVNQSVLSTSSTNEILEALSIGTSWVSGGVSNVVTAEDVDLWKHSDLVASRRVFSTDLETGASAQTVLMQCPSTDSAWRHFMAAFVETSMPVDEIASRCEKRNGLGDCGIVRFAPSSFHDAESAESLHVALGTLVLRVFGRSESNLVSTASCILDYVQSIRGVEISDEPVPQNPEPE